MIANIFMAITLLLKLIGLWEGFLDHVDKEDLAKAEERRQARAKAADDINKAGTEDEFDKASDRLHDNMP